MKHKKKERKKKVNHKCLVTQTHSIVMSSGVLVNLITKLPAQEESTQKMHPERLYSLFFDEL